MKIKFGLFEWPVHSGRELGMALTHLAKRTTATRLFMRYVGLSSVLWHCLIVISLPGWTCVTFWDVLVKTKCGLSLANPLGEVS